MKKYIYNAFWAVVGSFSLIGCTDQFSEINTNPNSPSSYLSYAVFNSANKEFIDGTRDGWVSARLSLSWMQYISQAAYTDESRYKYRDSQGDNLWFTGYSVAQDYKTIIDLNTNAKTKAETSVYGKNENQIAAARIMLAVVFSQLVESFGDIPYYSYGNNDPDFQALKISTNLTPVFVSQEKIYTDILKELKEAGAMITGADTDPVFTKGDAIFGSVGKMKRFANSLRLRLANRIKRVPSLSALAQSHITDAIASGVMTSNKDNVGLTYENNRTNPSPMYRVFFVDNRTEFTVSSSFIRLLKGDSGNFGVDPRLQKYASPKITVATFKAGNYTEESDITKYLGMPYGVISAAGASQQRNGLSYIHKDILKPNFTEMFMEYAEVCFLLSEVNNWDRTHYENGVKASMERWGIDSAKITSFVASLPTPTEENVITQKYIALYMQPHEAWSEYRRTGFPNTLLLPGQADNYNVPYEGKSTYTFTPLVNGLTDVPARLKYSNRYGNLNQENIRKALTNMSFSADIMNGKLIWAK